MIPQKLLVAYPFLLNIDNHQVNSIDFTVFCCPPGHLIEPLRAFDRRFSCHSLIYRHEREMRSKPEAHFCRAYVSAPLDLEGLIRLHHLQQQLFSGQIVVAYSRPLSLSPVRPVH